MKALLIEQFARHGIVARLDSAGTFDEQLPPTEPTVRLLSKRGIDVAEHRSRFIDADIVNTSHLIVTAEREHVVFIAGRWEWAFERVFTLPELVARAAVVGPRGNLSFDDWMLRINENRPRGADYLVDDEVGEIADPTGQSPATWREAVDNIESLSRLLAQAIR